MQVERTILKDCFIIKPTVCSDDRGYFFESFNKKRFEELTGLPGNFVQDNQSFSSYGVIRGLHAQSGDFEQAKLVRVLKGTVLDVAVDARIGSPTYGQHVAVELSEENRLQVYVPRGFLHGFSVLTEEAEFFYKCDNFYNKASEYGVMYNDQQLNINWGIPEDAAAISAKDLILGAFSDLNP